MMVPRLRYCPLIKEHDRAGGLMHEEMCYIEVASRVGKDWFGVFKYDRHPYHNAQ
jgi:hypothetical protein